MLVGPVIILDIPNTENTVKIDDYIRDNPDCIKSNTYSTKLQGNMKNLQVYVLPLDLTFYNIKNGRFAAEYADLKKKMGRDLDPTNTGDSKEIKDLLIDLDLKQSTILEKDIMQNGQTDPGIITYDGYVINGNRRRAVLENLVYQHGRSDLKFIIVARLPQKVSSQDLWKIEANIQLSRSRQLTYGPINELLKFQEGIQSGLGASEIANTLYGGFKKQDILDKLEEFKLIAEYLRFIKEPEIFNRAKGIHEHFIDLRKILIDYGKTSPRPDEVIKTKKICFQLIHDGVPSRDFRKVKDILAKEQSKKEFWTAEEYSKSEPINIKQEKKINADLNDQFTESRTIFNNCLDSVKALSESQQPKKLLERALKNLCSIDKEHCDLTDNEIKSLIDKVDKIMHDLRSN